jgi:eukaryotic-like serine/threonine-protein kinase
MLGEDIRLQVQSSLNGGYTIERELGGGGMSRTYVALEHALARRVVVKVLSPEMAAGVSVERFRREILLAAQMQHPHVVPVLSSGAAGSLPWFTMPFVEGESLRARLERGPLPITDTVSILRDVARALMYAHERGIIHRDIKPDNVLLSGGMAVVTDFGIAKAITASRTEDGRSNPTLTQLGAGVGTPAYMAPEQAAGDPNTDHRADLYSFGCMAYELLTGQPPFTEKSPQRLLAAHMSQMPTALTALRADAPPILSDLVMRCLAKEASERPSTATEVVQALETVSTTSSERNATVPAILLGGPGMLRKALGIYALAFAVVALLARVAIRVIGLPDWVFPGALILMAVGLPVVLFTGYVAFVTRRAGTITPTRTPGGTRSIATHGTMATLALKAAPHVSWYRTTRGGLWAVAAFVVIVAVFMAMRALGVGPAASLVSSGKISARDAVVLTDFHAAGTTDSTLGRVLSDAVRAGLSESTIMRLMDPVAITAALTRMQRPVDSRIDLSLARELATREGAKAIVDGEVSPIRDSYIIRIRLISVMDGSDLWSTRETADDPKELIDVADKVTRKLMAKAGESLRSVNGAPPLAEVTTGSIEAVRLYGEGMRAYARRDFPQARRRLQEAVAIDTNFASGWRALAFVLRNSAAPQQQVDSALARAYALRSRLVGRERELLDLEYARAGPHRDRAKTAAIYESMLARGDSSIANDFAGLLWGRRELARAETLARAGVRFQDTTYLPALGNLMSILRAQGKLSAADTILAAARRRFPNDRRPALYAAWLLWSRGDRDAFRAAAESARRVPDPTDPLTALGMWGGVLMDEGRIKEWLAVRASQVANLSAAGEPFDATTRAADALGLAAVLTNRVPPTLIRTLDSAVALESGRSLNAARAYAMAGRVDKAKQVLAKSLAALDTAELRLSTPLIHNVRASIAFAEHRWSNAIDEFRKADVRADGPTDSCLTCLPANLARVYDASGQTDSAIAQYELVLNTPQFNGWAQTQGGSVRRAIAHERLGWLYDAKGDSAKAVENFAKFVEWWDRADPELQPRVAAARERLRKLGTVPVRKRG